MSIKYDDIADAAYIRYTKNKVVNTIEFSEHLYVDIDKLDEVVGIEVIEVTDYLEQRRRMRTLSDKRLKSLQSKVTKDVIENKIATCSI